MSKRFGRNQKRRMREEQETLSAALAMSQGLARHISEQKRELESEVDDAKYFAANFCAAFAPETMTLSGPRRQVGVYEQQPVSMSLNADAPLPETLRRMPLRMLFAKVEQDRFRQAMHCRVQFGDGQWGYGITEPALANMPSERLVRIIAQEIAMQIARDVRRLA